MGYSTTFDGQFDLDKPLAAEHTAYLTAFAQTRRMKRDPLITEARPDPVRTAAGLPVGPEGGYFVNESGYRGQNSDGQDVTDYNRPPEGQPDLWCEWEPNEDGTAIVWDGNEKFYDYTEWLVYLIDNFLKPWGYTLNGDVDWQGEDADDRGRIVVVDNRVGVRYPTTSYGEVQWTTEA